MGILSKKFYALKRKIDLSYSDFMVMPVFLRESIIDMLIEENNPNG